MPMFWMFVKTFDFCCPWYGSHLNYHFFMERKTVGWINCLAIQIDSTPKKQHSLSNFPTRAKKSLMSAVKNTDRRSGETKVAFVEDAQQRRGQHHILLLLNKIHWSMHSFLIDFMIIIHKLILNWSCWCNCIVLLSWFFVRKTKPLPQVLTMLTVSTIRFSTQMITALV